MVAENIMTQFKPDAIVTQSVIAKIQNPKTHTMAPRSDELDLKVMTIAQALFAAYTQQTDTFKEALMASCVHQAKIQVADQARMEREGKA